MKQLPVVILLGMGGNRWCIVLEHKDSEPTFQGDPAVLVKHAGGTSWVRYDENVRNVDKLSPTAYIGLFNTLYGTEWMEEPADTIGSMYHYLCLDDQGDGYLKVGEIYHVMVIEKHGEIFAQLSLDGETVVTHLVDLNGLWSPIQVPSFNPETIGK